MNASDDRDLLRRGIAQARLLLVQLSPDGRITDCNDVFENTLHFAKDEVAGRPIWDLLASEYESRSLRQIFPLEQGQNDFAGFVAHVWTKEKKKRFVRWSAVTDANGNVLLLGYDLTTVPWATTKIEGKDNPYHVILNQMPVIAWTVDENMIVTAVMGGGLRVSNFESNQTIGMSMYELFHTTDPNHPEIKRFLETLSGKASKYEAEVRERTYETRLEPLRDEKDEIKGVIALAIDITDRKEIERNLQRLATNEKEARLEAERLNRVKDEFLITLSHELRTPLVPILGWIDLLKMPGLGEDDKNEALESMERNAHNELRLIEDLLDTSRIVLGKLSLEMANVDLNEITLAAAKAVSLAAAGKKINLLVDSSDESLIVSGDQRRLQQVIWNLLGNAIKFTPRSGSVHVQLSRMESFAMIKVQDSGIGIDSDFLPHVFERFRQADSTISRTFGGLGLGLSLVKNIVEAHGGTVKAESGGLNKGATFTVFLPIPSSLDQARSKDSPNVFRGAESSGER